MPIPRKTPEFDHIVKSEKFTGNIKIKEKIVKKWFGNQTILIVLMEYKIVADKVKFLSQELVMSDIEKIEWREMSEKDYIKYIEDNKFISLY